MYLHVSSALPSTAAAAAGGLTALPSTAAAPPSNLSFGQAKRLKELGSGRASSKVPLAAHRRRSTHLLAAGDTVGTVRSFWSLTGSPSGSDASLALKCFFQTLMKWPRTSKAVLPCGFSNTGTKSAPGTWAFSDCSLQGVIDRHPAKPVDKAGYVWTKKPLFLVLIFTILTDASGIFESQFHECVKILLTFHMLLKQLFDELLYITKNKNPVKLEELEEDQVELC
jgi:hypothetical protein